MPIFYKKNLFKSYKLNSKIKTFKCCFVLKLYILPTKSVHPAYSAAHALLRERERERESGKTQKSGKEKEKKACLLLSAF